MVRLPPEKRRCALVPRQGEGESRASVRRVPLATASVTGEVVGTPNAKMREQLGKGGPKLFTPWMALQDEESAEEK